MKYIVTSLFIATVAFSGLAAARTESVDTTRSAAARRAAKATDPKPTDSIETRRFKKKLESEQIPEEKIQTRLPPVATQPAVKEAVEE